MSRAHYYLFKYFTGMWRIGTGKSVREACKDAFGCVYGPESAIRYKDMGARQPKYLSQKALKAFYEDRDWLDLPR